jgi:N-methylhydantoinase A/oxoprolinase/acetone carboxylase beta subunit
VILALEEVLKGEDPQKIKRLCVTSTLGLNALLTGREDPTGVLAVPGPGLDPAFFWKGGGSLCLLSGAEDHRGIVVAPLDLEEVRQALGRLSAQGIAACAVASKFSPKNPELEYALRDLALEELGGPVVCGSEASGALNFPRRLHTAYCNAALTRAGRDFASALTQAAARLGLTCPIVIMKADAGVFANAEAAAEPAAAMGSGPAASLMGVLALLPFLDTDNASPQDLLMVDMGGTSTDLALMAGGQPLLAREGLTVAGRPTLIRSLWTRSIALGGDSILSWNNGAPRIGPERRESAAGSNDPGDPSPTLTDALVVLGHAKAGSPELSGASLRALGQDVRETALVFVNAALERIRLEADALLEEVNEKPVYTIRELLVTDKLKPRAAVFIGGPAEAMARPARQALGMPILVPPVAACANALGAALARPTRVADLYADTLRGRMSITSLGVEKVIDGGYTLDAAKKDLLAALDSLEAPGEKSPAQIVFAESFQVLEPRARGRIIKVRAQRAAGLLRTGEAA